MYNGTDMHTLFQMFGLISAQRKRLWMTIGLNTLLGLGAILPPLLLKSILDQLARAVRSGDHSAAAVQAVLLALAVMAGVRVLMAIASYIQERSSDILRLEVMSLLRRKLFVHVIGLSIEFYESTRSGEIVERLTEGVHEFGKWLQDVSETILLRILTIIFSVGVMTWVSPWAGLAAALTVAVKLWLAVRKKQMSKPHRQEAKHMVGVMIGQINETVQNLTTLKSFGGEMGSLAAHDQIVAEAQDARRRQHEVEWRYNIAIDLAEGLGMVLVFTLVALQALAGKASAGDIVLVALYMQQLMSNLRPMATFIDATGELISTCERMLGILAVEPTVKDAPAARELEKLSSIEFKNVNFSYPGHTKMVLKDVSFRLEMGQMLALVGPSGTGKTTIVKLLLRLYEQTSGEILINDTPIAEFTAASVRKHLGTVMQDVALFNDTLAANVMMAEPEATPTALRRAMKLAHVDEFAERLVDGYDTLVGERGVKLSGGQKQRVAIARAILKRPQLVLLDEATSALDSASEQVVQTGLNELMTGRMAVVIAHRLSTVMRADQILVIDGGRVLERGTHAELLAAGGLYAKLSALQAA